jgi:hypothetical protein
MFKFAESGIVAWPTEFPVDQDGMPTPTKVLVRYRPFTRTELLALDHDGARRGAVDLAHELVKLAQPPEGDTVDVRLEDAKRKAKATLETVEEAVERSRIRERERIDRVLNRVVSIQPPGEGDFVEFAPGELARQLEFEVLLSAYERGLMECSRAAVAKN